MQSEIDVVGEVSPSVPVPSCLENDSIEGEIDAMVRNNQNTNKWM